MKSFRIAAVLGIAGVFAIAGCGKKQSSSENQNAVSQVKTEQTPAKEPAYNAVCIYDGISLKAEPTKAGKWLASISLGETAVWLGDSSVDQTDKRSYQKIQLSDGKTGWATSYGLALNAKLGAIKENAVIYKRPDLLTASNRKIEFLSPVAVVQEKGEWIEFIGSARKKAGWIKNDVVTMEPNDVAVAVLASKNLAAAKDRTDAIQEIISSTPYPESFFIKKLQEQAAAVSDCTAVAPVQNAAESAPAPKAESEE